MRQSKFIRLINLYLDNEISKGDLQKLRQELNLSKQRQLLFNSYKRMNAILPQADIQFSTSNKSRWKLYLSGSFALLILVSLIFMNVYRGQDKPQETLASQTQLSNSWPEALIKLELREDTDASINLDVFKEVEYPIEEIYNFEKIPTFYSQKEKARQ